MEKEWLRKAIDRGLTIAEIAKESSKGKSTVRYWLKKFGLKTKHRSKSTRTWTEPQIREAIVTSVTVAEVLRKLGLTVRPGNYQTVYSFIEKHSLDVSHFQGQKASCGGVKPQFSISEICVKGSTYRNTAHLKKRLLRDGYLQNVCSGCGLFPQWEGKELRMVLDHINGDRTDHRLENLRLLCPNCNSQQPTFSRGQRGYIKKNQHNRKEEALVKT